MTDVSEWSARVDAWRSSGKSAADFCRGRAYSASTLYSWSSRLRSVRTAPPPNTKVRLARVVRVASEPSSGSCVIVVRVGDARVELPSTMDREVLSAVLETLLDASGSARR